MPEPSGDFGPQTAPAVPPTSVDDFIHHTELARTALSEVLDRCLRIIGETASWLWAVLVGIIVFNVTLRYLFGEGRIEFEELQWHLAAIAWIVGFSYATQSDSHIRIDILHERFSMRTKAWIDLIGILVLLMPFIAVVLIYAPPFIAFSFETGEVSDAPGGLPYRWAIKSFMLIGFILLLIAGFSRLLRAWATLFGGARPDRMPH